MTFVAELRDELLAIERNPLEGTEKRVLSANEVAAIRRAVIELYNEADQTLPPHTLHDFRKVLFDTKLFNRIAEVIARELQRGLCSNTDPTTLASQVVLVWRMHWMPGRDAQATGLGRGQRTEIYRIGRLAIGRHQQLFPPLDIEAYCFELRLVRLIERGRILSPIGNALVSLPEQEAIAWLLWLESKQLVGKSFPSNVSQQVAAALTAEAQSTKTADGSLHFDSSGFHWSLVHHLVALGLAETEDPTDSDIHSFSIPPTFRPILLDIAQQRQTPLSLVINTMLAAERDEIITRVVPSAPPSLSATDAQSQHAKMVVHELRNVLTPVKATLSMARDHLEAGRSAEAIPLVDRVEQSVKRLFHFADELSRFTAIAAPQPEMLDVTQVIRDAIASLNGGVKITYDLALATDLPRVVGHRDRLALVVINILRNAAQVSTHASARVRVTAGLSPALDSVRLAFEDDGPGVDDGLRETIFQPGFSLRLGGSGQGLALVRQVVEVEMHGKVECAKGSLGGALFELILPAVKSD